MDDLWMILIELRYAVKGLSLVQLMRKVNACKLCAPALLVVGGRKEGRKHFSALGQRERDRTNVGLVSFLARSHQANTFVALLTYLNHPSQSHDDSLNSFLLQRDCMFKFTKPSISCHRIAT